jgi:hypothetical protein
MSSIYNNLFNNTNYNELRDELKVIVKSLTDDQQKTIVNILRKENGSFMTIGRLIELENDRLLVLNKSKDIHPASFQNIAISQYNENILTLKFLNMIVSENKQTLDEFFGLKNRDMRAFDKLQDDFTPDQRKILSLAISTFSASKKMVVTPITSSKFSIQ